MTGLWRKSDSLDFTRLYLEPGLITVEVQLSAAVQPYCFAAVAFRRQVARQGIAPLNEETPEEFYFDQKVTYSVTGMLSI